MFFELSQTDFTSFADDNTPYVEANNINKVIKTLENDSIWLFQWFSDNQIKANKNDCLLAINNNEKVSMNIDDIKIENTSSEKLLGIIIDSKLNFKQHLEGIIKNFSRKMNVLSRITPYVTLVKPNLLIISIFTSQLNYCSLVWICYNRIINNKISRLHEIAYNDNKL